MNKNNSKVLSLQELELKTKKVVKTITWLFHYPYITFTYLVFFGFTFIVILAPKEKFLLFLFSSLLWLFVNSLIREFIYSILLKIFLPYSMKINFSDVESELLKTLTPENFYINYLIQRKLKKALTTKEYETFNVLLKSFEGNIADLIIASKELS